MKRWVLKAIVQKSISYLPLSNKINYFFQKYVTKGLALSDEYFFDRLEHARNHIRSYQQFAHNAAPLASLEIGTGWYPIVPIALFLIGCERIFSLDISLHTSKKLLQATLKKFLDYSKDGKLNYYLDFQPERLEILSHLLNSSDDLHLNELLKRLNITYLIGDARSIALPDNSVDLVNSNNTFEHIYPEILSSILKEFRRVVKKHGGVMSHFIDMSDHFAHFDKSISIYNFLRFSDRQWKWIDNSIQPQNRLRIDDYMKMYAELDIPISELRCRQGNVELLKTLPLAERFQSKSLEETAKSHCHIVSFMDN